MNRTTTRLLTAPVLAAALTLSACGGSSDSGSSSSSSGSSSAAADSDAKRTVTDAMGTKVEVPANPKKVVSLHYAASEAVYDLGGSLAGQGIFEKGIIPAGWENTLGKVPVVTTQTEVKVEEVAKLKPDLILAPNTTKDDVLEQLKAIAPVYRFTLRSENRGNWEKRVDEVADALNKTDKVSKLRSDYEARQKAIATKYADVIKGKKVGVVGSYANDTVYVWGKENMTGKILMPLGFTWSPAEQKIASDPGIGTGGNSQVPENEVSAEKLPSSLGDADVIFYDTDLQNETNAFMKAIMSTSMWKNLPAVKAGRAYPIGKNTVAGYADANYSLDQIEASLKEIK